jgi:hypothetical protein
MRLIEPPSGFVCVECFVLLGEHFVGHLDDVPIFVPFAECVACKASARRRLLVAGVGAAICHSCYLAIKRGMAGVKADPSNYPLTPARLRALKHSRAARLRARRERQRINHAFRSLSLEEKKTRGGKLITKRVATLLTLVRHLKLITSAERVRGRPALKGVVLRGAYLANPRSR